MIKAAEREVELVEIKIEVNQDVIRDYDSRPRLWLDDVRLQHRASLSHELPHLYNELERKKKFLRELRGI